MNVNSDNNIGQCLPVRKNINELNKLNMAPMHSEESPPKTVYAHKYFVCNVIHKL